MKDWGELWLNEGFATYFENVGASIARPNFAYYDTFYSSFATAAMEEDSYPKSTHPLATLTGEKILQSNCSSILFWLGVQTSMATHSSNVQSQHVRLHGRNAPP